jgi:hypothetical protein
MDLKTIGSELQKFKIINQQFQVKLGEITILITNTNIIETSPKEIVYAFIKALNEYLCHYYYLEYSNSKMRQSINHELTESNLINTQSSLYDNSMNLILVLNAKISKVSQTYAKYIIDTFIEHINTHTDCFNYIISFYRLYITCPHLKSAAKEYDLYLYLCEYYKKIYYISYNSEALETSRDLKGLAGMERCSNKKDFLQNFKLESNIVII